MFEKFRTFLTRRIAPRLRRVSARAKFVVRHQPKRVALGTVVAALLLFAVLQATSNGGPFDSTGLSVGAKATAVSRSMFERARHGEADPYRAIPARDASAGAGAVTYTRFLELAKSGEIAATILPRPGDSGETVAFETGTGQFGTTALPSPMLVAPVVDLLIAHQVEILTDTPPMINGDQVSAIARALFPILLLVCGFAFLLRRGPGGIGMPGEWILPDDNGARFADVQGVDEAKAELVEAVEHLLDPGAAGDLGAKPPRGVLLVGQPGTGKTMLARAVAGEAGAAFLRLSGSDFVEMWVGLGARRVRTIFKAARKRAPCVIFIDEIDSLGRKRGAGSSGGDRESDQTLNALLVELDGFARDDRILVLGATNRVDTLDDALVRPGRFDRHIHFGLPDMNGRRAILEAHAREFKLEDQADLQVVARGTPGFSGADLANLVNEAAFAANRRGGKAIGAVDLEAARDRVLMGSERKSLVWREEERVLTAWHEAGHALVALLTPDSDPVHKATILPRGGALGMVMRLPEHDRFAISRAKLEADLAVAVGGRVAEKLKFGGDRISTGAEADIRAATDLAYSMVARWGMSERLGFMRWTSDDQTIPAPVRREMKREIDGAMARVRHLIATHRAALDAIAEALLDRETLDRVELERIVAAALPAPCNGEGPAAGLS